MGDDFLSYTTLRFMLHKPCNFKLNIVTLMYSIKTVNGGHERVQHLTMGHGDNLATFVPSGPASDCVIICSPSLYDPTGVEQCPLSRWTPHVPNMLHV